MLSPGDIVSFRGVAVNCKASKNIDEHRCSVYNRLRNTKEAFPMFSFGKSPAFRAVVLTLVSMGLFFGVQLAHYKYLDTRLLASPRDYIPLAEVEYIHPQDITAEYVSEINAVIHDTSFLDEIRTTSSERFEEIEHDFVYRIYHGLPAKIRVFQYIESIGGLPAHIYVDDVEYIPTNCSGCKEGYFMVTHSRICSDYSAPPEEYTCDKLIFVVQHQRDDTTRVFSRAQVDGYSTKVIDRHSETRNYTELLDMLRGCDMFQEHETLAVSD